MSIIDGFARPDDPYTAARRHRARAEHLLWQAMLSEAHRITRASLDQLADQQDGGWSSACAASHCARTPTW